MRNGKRLFKKIIGCLLTASVVFGSMPLRLERVKAAELGTGKLYVAGVDIVSAENNTVSDGDDGTAVLSYEGGNPVLTLTDFDYEANGKDYNDSYNAAIYYYNYYNSSSNHPLIIRLNGTNKIINTQKANDNGGYKYYAAILGRSPLEFEGTGSLIAKSTGDYESLDNYGNFGIFVRFNTITINSGNITASAGKGLWSCGIYSEDKLTTNGGTINATGGIATADFSCGLYGSTLSLQGGDITAIATTTGKYSAGIMGYGSGIEIDNCKIYAKSDVETPPSGGKCGGICGLTTIGSNVYIKAIGNPALTSHGASTNVKNAVAGTGWSDTAMTEGETAIPISSQYKQITYKAVLFDHYHAHNFTSYSSSGATISATCGAAGCMLTENIAKITIVAPAKTKYGDSNSELATITGDTNALGKPAIVYKSGTDVLAEAPTEIGTYTASMTLEGQTATVEYTIGKGQYPYAPNPQSEYNAKYGDELSSIKLPDGWAWKTPTTIINALGNQQFTAVYTPEDTEHYDVTEQTVYVMVQKGDCPAIIEETAAVTKGGKTVDLSQYVDKNGTSGTVTYEITSDDFGCEVNSSTGIFTSGDEPGTVTVRVNVAGDDYYNDTSKDIAVTVTNKETQTLEFESNSITKTYGDEAFTNTLSGAKTDVSYEIIDGLDVASVDSTGKVTIKNIGEATIAATAAETTAYLGVARTYTLKVTRKSITVKADDKEMAIGDPQPNLTATVTGLVGNDTVDYYIEREPGNSIGKYAIKPFGDTEQGNYEITYESGTFTIKAGDKYVKAPLIKTISSDFIEVETINGYVYGISSNDDLPNEWTSEGTFTDLEENTEYTVYMKLEDNADDTATSTKVTTTEKGKGTQITEEHEALGDGFVRTETRINSDAPVGKIENLTPSMISSFLGENSDEIQKVKNGSTLLVYLKVENADESAPEDDKKKIEEKAKDNSDSKIAQYIDLSLYMQIDDDDPQPISNLNNNRILVRISIPENFRLSTSSEANEEITESENLKVSAVTERKFYIARVHNGETDLLETTTDGDDIIFETDRFSTYALLYSDTESGSNIEPEPTPQPEENQTASLPTLVVKNKSNIKHLFSKYGEVGYKYKFKVENKAQRKVLTVNKKGKVKVKSVGTAVVSLFRKVKGGSWTKVEEQTLTAEKPNIPKTITNLKVGDTVYASSFITNAMVNSPTSYVSSKPDVVNVASSTGLITVRKRGKAKITIIYGTGKGAAKYKVKLKIQ